MHSQSPMRVFLDTNIMIDLLGRRDPFYISAAQVATLGEEGVIKLFVSPLSIATTYYILTQYQSKRMARTKLQKLKTLTEITVMDSGIVEKGLASEFKDFEDALQYFSALSIRADVVLTRNQKDFKAAEIPVLDAQSFLASMKKRP